MSKTTGVCSINFKPDLLEKIDKEAKSLSMSRSAFLNMCVNQYFRTEEAKDLLAKASELFEMAKSMQDAQGNTYYQTLLTQKEQ